MWWEGRQGEPFISQNRDVTPTLGAGFINKFYWNTAMPTCLYVVYGCVCAQFNNSRVNHLWQETCWQSWKYLPSGPLWTFADLCQRRWRNLEFETVGWWDEICIWYIILAIRFRMNWKECDWRQGAPSGSN